MSSCRPALYSCSVSSPSSSSPLLVEQLQQLTQALAATHTQVQVLDATLAPAIQALSAVSGAILLLDPDTQCLTIAAMRGHAGQTLWQDGPLTPQTPAGDALMNRHPLYFEHAGALTSAYPHLEEHTGGIAAVATAVLPLLLEGQGLGVLILDFREPHTFTAEERQFLPSLAGQCSIALGRAQLIDALQFSDTRFRHLIDASPVGVAVGSLDGRLTQVNDTYLHLLGYSRAQFEAGNMDWQRLTPPEYQAQDQTAFETAFREGAATPYEKEMLTRTGERLPVGITLLRYNDRQIVGYVQDLRAYKAEQQVLRDEGHRLEGLVVERTAALQAFVRFTTTVASSTDLEVLARAAADVVDGTVDGGLSGFYLIRDDTAYPVFFSENTPSEVVAARRAGVPLQVPLLQAALQHPGTFFADVALSQQYAPGFGTLSVRMYRQDGRPHAVLTTNTPESVWSEQQKAIIESVGDGLGLALQRAAQARQLEEERESLAAFAAFTEAVGTKSEVLTLAQQAVTALRTTLPGISAAYYARVQDLWVGQAWSEDVAPEVVVQIQAGVPATAPDFAQAVQTGQPVFKEGWDAPGNDLSEATMYGAAGFLPLVVDGQTYSLLAVGTQTSRRWSARERGIVQAVAQGLTLALERSQAAQHLVVQKREAERRTQALEAFAELSRELPGETDRYALVRRAQEIMLSLLTPGYALYWEAGEDRWHLKSQVGDIGDPALQAFVDEYGLPLDAPALTSTWLTGVPNYQDNYAQGADTPADMIRHVQAATAFQVRLYGQPLGMLAIGLFDQRQWTSVDRAALETAIYSLTLVLERAQGLEALAGRTAQLAQANTELTYANQELEAFTYSASHDMRTPVRHITGFTGLALRALQSTPNPKAERHLGVVAEAAVRINRMIDAMLALSRAGRTELHLRLVPLASLVEQARTDAMLEFPERNVDWQIGPLPTVRVDTTMLQQVLTNLLSNAVKFAASDRIPQVQLWAEEQPGEWLISVRDNGVGFNPDYTDKLFGAFQRLHRQEEFAGTGIGLATVRRIVTRHGGRVWAEGRLGEGATFGFSLPHD